MATLASRVFVLYVAVPASVNGLGDVESLHEVARRGCSGLLTLPGPETASKDLLAVLGIDDDAPTGNNQFPFPKMPIACFSTSGEAIEAFKSAGIRDVEYVSSSNAESSIARVRSLTRVDDSRSKQLVFFHVTEEKHAIFDFLSELVGAEDAGTSSECFIAILRATNGDWRSTEPTHPLRPRQSHERHHGKYQPPSVSGGSRRLLYASYHPDRTRRDQVAAFTEHDVESLGAYGSMDARILMKELAFRLGFAPKYGA